MCDNATDEGEPEGPIVSDLKYLEWSIIHV
jgi:hypothetical protein